MKKILIFAIFILLVFPNSALANGAGLPAFFEVNGKYSTANPLQVFGITAQSFLIPQDYAPENYVVNQPINFTIDEKQLEIVIPRQLFDKTKFAWDFGDGSKADGLINTHTYTKIGSYILVLTINIYETDGQAPTQFIDSYLLNILPDKNYKGLPHAVITLNNQQIDSNSNTPVNVNFKYPISLDASKSKAAPSKITTYLWDFGDGQTNTLPAAMHTYESRYFATVVLRIKDSSGFISDSFVGLMSNPNLQERVVVSKKSAQNSDSLKYFLIAVVFVAMLLIVTLIIKAIIVKRHKNDQT